jgi:NADPH-dependent glutamate synthase beta subunit-like oxidoreductase
LSENFKSITALSLAGGDSSAPQDLFWLEQNIPCQAACPAGTDIPGYLEAVYQGRFREAYEINLRDNVFPAILGRVCSRPCEDACRHGRDGNGEPVAICFSKRSAADFAQSEAVVMRPLFPATGKHVGIIGAGVAGLAVARDLALFGHQVTVYEKHARPGGMLNQGIPAFRLPRDLISREIDQITALGVEIRCGVDVGTEVGVEALLESHDALVLAAGTLRPNISCDARDRPRRRRTRIAVSTRCERERAPRHRQARSRDRRWLHGNGLRTHCRSARGANSGLLSARA